MVRGTIDPCTTPLRLELLEQRILLSADPMDLLTPFAPASPIIVDDGDAEYAEAGTGWDTGALPGGYAADYRFHAAGAGSNSAT